MKLIRYCVVLVIILAVVPFSAYAGGFQINEHGTKAMGMGGAFSAQASDGSAMFYNPAGLGFQQGFKVLAGATLIAPSTSWTSASGSEEKMESQVFFPPHAYVSYGDPSGWTFGVGFYAPFGLGTEWLPDWTGRYAAVKTDLQTFFINPSAAYKISDQFSLGIGVSYVFSNVKLSRKVGTFSGIGPPPVPSSTDGEVFLEADGTSFNWNAGLMFKPNDQVSIGVSYRHSTDIDYDGDATFQQMQVLAPFFPGGKGATTIVMPNNIFAGVAVQATPELILEADFQYIMWSTYDTLAINIPDGPTFPLTGTPLQTASKSGRDWENAWMIRVGGEYQLESVALRAGFIYDKTPQPDKSVEPLVPDANRIEFTLGVGFEISENVVVDAAYQLILSSDRDAATPSSPTSELAPLAGGTYKSTAHLFGVTLGFNL
ncbi:MAG: outer membrane protein transport protein [Bacteroidota bacterium]